MHIVIVYGQHFLIILLGLKSIKSIFLYIKNTTNNFNVYIEYEILSILIQIGMNLNKFHIFLSLFIIILNI